MSVAGRILIMPKGDYDANSAYEKLDLVRHKGTSWIAKKDVTGIEPSEANAEHWQNMFDIIIADNLTTEEAGQALDATQGKILDDKITALSKNFVVSSVQNPTMNISGYKGSIDVFKNGKAVQLSLNLFIPVGQTISSWESLVVATLPDDLKPRAGVHGVPVIVHNKETIPLLMSVGSTGKISLVTLGKPITFGDGDAVRGYCTFVTV